MKPGARMSNSSGVSVDRLLTLEQESLAGGGSGGDGRIAGGGGHRGRYNSDSGESVSYSVCVDILQLVQPIFKTLKLKLNYLCFIYLISPLYRII